MDFDNDKTFYTETMAKLLSQQGRYERAAEVYRHLLEQTPHREDLEQALDNVLCAIPKATARWERIQGLIERWVTQVLRYKVLRQLQHISIRKIGEKRAGE